MFEQAATSSKHPPQTIFFKAEFLQCDGQKFMTGRSLVQPLSQQWGWWIRITKICKIRVKRN